MNCIQKVSYEFGLFFYGSLTILIILILRGSRKKGNLQFSYLEQPQPFLTNRNLGTHTMVFRRNNTRQHSSTGIVSYQRMLPYKPLWWGVFSLLTIKNQRGYVHKTLAQQQADQTKQEYLHVCIFKGKCRPFLKKKQPQTNNQLDLSI